MHFTKMKGPFLSIIHTTFAFTIEVLFLSHFVCILFYFGMSSNIVLFLKVKVINLLMFLSYFTLFLKLFKKKTNKYFKN